MILQSGKIHMENLQILKIVEKIVKNHNKKYLPASKIKEIKN